MENQPQWNQTNYSGVREIAGLVLVTAATASAPVIYTVSHVPWENHPYISAALTLASIPAGLASGTLGFLAGLTWASEHRAERIRSNLESLSQNNSQ